MTTRQLNFHFNNTIYLFHYSLCPVKLAAMMSQIRIDVGDGLPQCKFEVVHDGPNCWIDVVEDGMLDVGKYRFVVDSPSSSHEDEQQRVLLVVT